MRKALTHLRTADPVLGGIIDRLGVSRMVYRPATFDAVVQAIINQQLSGKAAATIYGRLQAALAPKGVEPRGILKLGEGKLRTLGISAQKCSYLLDLAAKTRRKEVDFEKLPALPDEVILEQLTAIKGIGVWTVHMFLIFALRRPDVLPSGDLGIQNAVQKAYGLESRPKPKQVEEIGAKWRPYSSYAAWYLWRSLE
ncbi:MAG: DNA-3-methyladenine glycosylase [Bryobacteraceae bacterium]|jgi:DNA-3-methyladenine glycosylase II